MPPAEGPFNSAGNPPEDGLLVHGYNADAIFPTDKRVFARVPCQVEPGEQEPVLNARWGLLERPHEGHSPITSSAPSSPSHSRRAGSNVVCVMSNGMAVGHT